MRDLAGIGCFIAGALTLPEHANGSLLSLLCFAAACVLLARRPV